ncbi:hypothetical protein LSTR_LSTR016142, partial [Laodelphax striatellus]
NDRENWIISYKKFLSDRRKNNEKDGFRTSHINKNLPDAPVYINENLSPYYRNLLKETKSFAKENNFMFTWVRNGKIYVRKNENSRAIRIMNMCELENFKLDNINMI